MIIFLRFLMILLAHKQEQRKKLFKNNLNDFYAKQKSLMYLISHLLDKNGNFF